MNLTANLVGTVIIYGGNATPLRDGGLPKSNSGLEAGTTKGGAYSVHRFALSWGQGTVSLELSETVLFRPYSVALVVTEDKGSAARYLFCLVRTLFGLVVCVLSLLERLRVHGESGSCDGKRGSLDLMGVSASSNSVLGSYTVDVYYFPNKRSIAGGKDYPKYFFRVRS